MKRLLLPIVPTVLVVLLLEAALRVCFSIATDIRAHRQEADERWWVYSAELGWETRPGYSGNVFGAARAFDGDGYLTVDSRQVDDPKTPKVLILGDSCAFGNGVDVTRTFGEVLDRLLDGYSVINLAVPGYSSYQGVGILRRQIGRIRPAIIVAAFNYNDRRYVQRPEETDGASHFKVVYDSSRSESTVKRLEYVSYIFRAMMRLYAASTTAFSESRNPPAASVDTLHPRVSVAGYRANLVAMIELAREHGAQMMFLALRDNPNLTVVMRRAIELAGQDRNGEAVGLLERMEETGFLSVLRRKYLASALERTGRASEASAVRRIPQPVLSVHGGEPLFPDSDYDAVMRAVSAEYRVPLIDGGAILEEHPEYYTDMCHFDGNGHLILAEGIAKVIRARREGALPPESK
jgi:hypothetical protein